MQAVILAAGRGTRMGMLTTTTPKPLLSIHGKTLLERTLDSLPSEITEVILVVHYFAEDIKKHIGSRYSNKSITYVYQQELLGTGMAVHAAREYVHGQFLVLMADDIYSRESLTKATQFPWSITVQKMPWTPKKASISTNADGYMNGITLEQTNDGSAVVNTGLYSLTEDFFDYPLVQIPENGEYSLPHTLAAISTIIHISVLKTTGWIQINTQAELASAEQTLGF